MQLIAAVHIIKAQPQTAMQRMTDTVKWTTAGDIIIWGHSKVTLAPGLITELLQTALSERDLITSMCLTPIGSSRNSSMLTQHQCTQQGYPTSGLSRWRLLLELDRSAVQV